MARAIKSLTTLARERTEEAFDAVVDLLACEDPKMRLAAAREILDRGHGKPLSAVITIPADQQQRARLAAMTDDQLVEVIEAEFEPLPALPPPAEAEVEPLDSSQRELPEIDADPLFN